VVTNPAVYRRRGNEGYVRACMPRLPIALILLAGCTGGRPLSPLSSAGPARDTAGSDSVRFDVAEATRLAFDLAPDGSTIVFDLLGQLWRVPVAGGEAVALTHAVRDTAEDLDPAVSPDGRHIVFQSDRPGGRGVWIMPLAGGPARRLTSRVLPFFVYAAPAWSPDSRRIAYTIGDSLAVLDVDRGEEAVLHFDSLPAPSQRSPFLPRNGVPSWSRDGQRLVFVNTAKAPVRGDGLIWEGPATGGTARPLTSVPGLAPIWSPDGTRLAFLARDSAGHWQVWIQQSGTARALTHQDEVETLRLRWMPDGRALVYAAQGRLWRIAADGGEPARIPFRARVVLPRRKVRLKEVRFPEPGAAREANGFTAIALSPEGARIAMIALDTLWVIDPDGRPRALGRADGAGDRGLSWSPDGREVAWTRRDGPGEPHYLVASNIGTGASRIVAKFAADVILPNWSPDGKWIGFFAAGHLRLVDPAGTTATQLQQTRDLGSASAAFGTMTWSPHSNGLIVAASSPGTDGWRTRPEWIPLEGARSPIKRFPPMPADFQWLPGGRAVWVENNLLWSAGFDSVSGLQGEPAVLSTDPAIEPRYAADGRILYLSPGGLRLRAPDGAAKTIGWPLRFRAAAAPAPLMLRGARVIDGKGSPLSEPRDLLIQSGRIARIGPSGTIAADGAQVIDASGRYLMPGMIDLHFHLWDDLALPAALHNGVTTVRDIASQRLRTPDIRNAIEAGVRPGPRLVFGGAMFHRGTTGYTSLTDQVVNDAGSMDRALSILSSLGLGYVKERGFEGWWGAVNLVGAAHRQGLPVSGHCAHPLPVAAAGMDGAEHVLDCFSTARPMREDFAELARAAGQWIVPTAALRFSRILVMDEPAMLQTEEVAPFLQPQYREFYGTDSTARRGRPPLETAMARLRRDIGRYREAGVILATGTDSPFPLGVQHEMQVLVESGLTPMEAVVAATGNAARVLNAPEIGTIGEGQWADLLLLDANPLDDIRNLRRIREVIQGGRIIDRRQLRNQGLKPVH
jgi:imidazolonepropionase-like amidohydrolase/Tol biopolymer transport system component